MTNEELLALVKERVLIDATFKSELTTLLNDGKSTNKTIVATNVLGRYVAWNKSVSQKGYYQFAFDVLSSDAKDARVIERVVWQHYTGLDKLPDFFNYVKPGSLHLLTYGVVAGGGQMTLTSVVNGMHVKAQYHTRNAFSIARYVKPKA